MDLHGRRRAKFRQEPEFYESFRRVIVSRSDAVAKRQAKIAGSLPGSLIEQGIEDGEFRPQSIPWRPPPCAGRCATAFFLHPAVMPSALSNRGEERALAMWCATSLPASPSCVRGAAALGTPS